MSIFARGENSLRFGKKPRLNFCKLLTIIDYAGVFAVTADEDVWSDGLLDLLSARIAKRNLHMP